MPQKNAAKLISAKTSAIWACSACPTPDGLKSHNSGYELWDNDECSDAHWGFGSLQLSKDNPKGEPTGPGAFFGKINKWPNKKSHVLLGYARGLVEAKGKKVNVKIGPTDFVRDSAWRLMKIPLGKGPMLDTVNDGHKGRGTVLLDDWIVGDQFADIEYAVDGRTVSAVELYRIEDGTGSAVLKRKDVVPAGKRVVFKAGRCDTTHRYLFKLQKRGGGVESVPYPKRLDCVLRAHLPLEQAITVRLKSSALWNVLYTDESRDCALELTSVADEDLAMKVQMSVTDFWGREVSGQSFAVRLPALGKLTRKYKIPKGLHGHFAVVWKIKCGGQALCKESSFCIVPRRPSGFKDPDKSYFSAYFWRRINPLFARLGIGLQMMEVTGSWNVREVCESFDRDLYSKGRKLGINYLVRPWRDEKGTIKAPKDWKGFGRFVRGVATYFSERGATHFDTWNEPQYWLKGTPAQVAKVMIETYMNIKAANPKAKIAAPGLLHSMEYNGKVLRAALREGKKRGIEEHFPFFDIYNIHYGDFPLEDEYIKYIRSHRELLKEFGLPADMPIWNTELGMWYYGGAMKNPKKHDTARYEWYQAKYYVRHCLLGFPEGVTHNLLFTMADLTRVREHSLDAPDADDVSMSNWEPRRAYAAYAVLIDEIDLTDYESTLDLGKNVYAFVFRRADGGRTIALWTFENTSKHPWANRRVTVKLPVKSRNPVVVDFMGTPKKLRAGGGSVKIPVDGYPCYLQDPPVKK